MTIKKMIEILSTRLTKEEFLELANIVDSSDYHFSDAIAEKAAELDPDNYCTEDFDEDDSPNSEGSF